VPAMLLTGLVPGWRLLLWLVPLHDPPANTWGALALSVIWYLRDFLWFVLLSPVAVPLFRRWPVPTLLIPYAVLAVAESGVTLPPVVADIGLYFGAWLLGVAHHDGTLRRVGWRVLLPVVGVLMAVGAAWFLTHPGPRGFDLNDIRLGNALWSTGFTLLLLRLAPSAGTVLDGPSRAVASAVAWLERRRWISRTVTLLNARALTIYLWHMPIVIGVIALAGRRGWPLFSTTGLLTRVAIVAALVAVAVALVGWVEDIAARRRPRLMPIGGPGPLDRAPGQGIGWAGPLGRALGQGIGWAGPSGRAPGPFDWTHDPPDRPSWSSGPRYARDSEVHASPLLHDGREWAMVAASGRLP